MFVRTNVRNYADAYRVIQAMDLQAPLNTSEVREAVRESLGKVLATRMNDYIDQYLDEARDLDLADRCSMSTPFVLPTIDISLYFSSEEISS